MSTETRSVDELQAFMEKHQAKDLEEATRLYNTVPVLREVALAISNFIHIVTILSLLPGSAREAKEAANMTRNLAVTLYLIGYRAGQKATDAD